MEKIFALVGTYDPTPGAQRGIHVFEYKKDTARFLFKGDYMPNLNAGQIQSDHAHNMVYVTHENREPDAGAICAFKLDGMTGQLEPVNTCRTLATLPTYVCIDSSGKYALVPHHGTDSATVKTVRNTDGSFGQIVESDDCTLVLIPLRKDGSLGKVCDVSWHSVQWENGVRRLSQLHCCVQSPDGELFLVCDTGLDVIHSYHVDERNGLLKLLRSTPCLRQSHPRYIVFHPSLSVCYQNNERSAFLNVWNYNSKTGVLKQIQRIGLMKQEKASESFQELGASDLIMTSDGRFLYAAIRGVNLISAYEVEPNGTLRFLQNVSCGGINPRGLGMSGDSRFLFSLNRNSNQIQKFRVGVDGMLTPEGTAAECRLPCCMSFVTCRS